MQKRMDVHERKNQGIYTAECIHTNTLGRHARFPDGWRLHRWREWQQSQQKKKKRGKGATAGVLWWMRECMSSSTDDERGIGCQRRIHSRVSEERRHVHSWRRKYRREENSMVREGVYIHTYEYTYILLLIPYYSLHTYEYTYILLYIHMNIPEKVQKRTE